MNENNSSNEETGDYTTGDAFDDRYVSVNDYTGEGYDLVNGEKMDVIANEKFAEIEEAMKAFFLEEYKIDVIVHNVVGNVDGATVFVESVGEPHFHTYAMIGIDRQDEEIIPDSIWTQSSQVEQSLFGGLLAMIMDEEFAVLDDFVEELADKHPIVGWRQEAINNVGSTGYTTPYYFIQPMTLRDEMEEINDLYFKNPNISADELKSVFDKDAYNANYLRISIQVYMDEADSQPIEALFDEIVQEFKALEGLPRGNYSISLHDNYVNKLSASGNQDNSLNTRDLIKE
ncbi:DUF1672 family protein [Amphibacillus cookii]|uniref:DUF1672 family protein n=1 Tax=Amphibacillus cookii TaxID=767787 RepID=UPI00195965CA|nr:DUF1672 family protein [Amphibacillus cookii]MBM7542918.1 hypothetical protein [Amphibacillus cookii]